MGERRGFQPRRGYKKPEGALVPDRTAREQMALTAARKMERQARAQQRKAEDYRILGLGQPGTLTQDERNRIRMDVALGPRVVKPAPERNTFAVRKRTEESQGVYRANDFGGRPEGSPKKKKKRSGG